jgi:hypothetical protein
MIRIKKENGKNILYHVTNLWIPHFNGPGLVSVSSTMKIGEVEASGLELDTLYNLDWKEDFEEIGRKCYVLHDDGLRYDEVKYKLKQNSFYKLMYGI